LTHIKCGQLDSKQAGQVTKENIDLITPFSWLVHAFTSDNVKECAWHEAIAKQFKINGCFAHSYHSWKRRVNKNSNALLR
jgi:IS30 family transposase